MVPLLQQEGWIVVPDSGMAGNLAAGWEDMRFETPPAEPLSEDFQERQRALQAARVNALLKRFDVSVFGKATEDKARRVHLEEMLRERLDLAHKTHYLRDAEKAKLRLAGQGDIKHLLDRVAAKRAVYWEESTIGQSPQKLRAEVLVLTRDYLQGPFGDGSLFAKTLKTIEKNRSILIPRPTNSGPI